jgi:FkbM family methyltransferase
MSCPRTPLAANRIIGKFLLFLSRGTSPAKAWWLARRDALKQADYRRVPLSDLAAAWEAAGAWSDFSVSEGTIVSRRLGLPLRAGSLVAQCYPTLVALADRRFVATLSEEGVVITDGRIRIRASTEEEFSILQEIFVERNYCFQLPGSWTVLDIGANVGIASLYFAAQPGVHQVIAFEPFPATADLFEAQMALNPELAAKISLLRFGLDAADGTFEASYVPALRGSMSIHGLGAWRGGTEATGNRTTVAVRRASKVLEELAPRLANKPILAKIDCEGSEYGILRDLDATRAIDRIDAIVMEWHQHGPDELVAILLKNDFVVYHRGLGEGSPLGLITAVRRVRRSGD